MTRQPVLDPCGPHVEQSVVPSGWTATRTDGPTWAPAVTWFSPVAASHTRTVWSNPAVTIAFPPSAHATPVQRSVCPFHAANSFPVAASQTRTCPSSPAPASFFPSGENLGEVICTRVLAGTRIRSLVPAVSGSNACVVTTVIESPPVLATVVASGVLANALGRGEGCVIACVTSGSAKLAWFSALNISTRNCTLKFSEIALTAWFLNSEKSRLVTPGPVSALRERLPRLPNPGSLKHSSLMY